MLTKVSVCFVSEVVFGLCSFPQTLISMLDICTDISHDFLEPRRSITMSITDIRSWTSQAEE